MKKYICPDCKKEFEEGAVPSICPNCGCPSEQFTIKEIESSPELSSNLSPALESSNNFGAEHTVNGLAVVNLWLGIIIGAVCLIAGVGILMSGGFGTGLIATILLIVGPLVFLSCLIFWAVLKLLVNISYRLTRLDNKSNPK